MDASQGYTKTTVHMFNYTRQYCDIYKLEHFYITEKIITHNCFLFLRLIRIIYQRNYTITQTLTHKNTRARAHARTHTHTQQQPHPPLHRRAHTSTRTHIYGQSLSKVTFFGNYLHFTVVQSIINPFKAFDMTNRHAKSSCLLMQTKLFV